MVPNEAAILLKAAAHGNSHLSTKNVYALLRTYFRISALNELATMVSHSCLQCAYNRAPTRHEQQSGHVVHRRAPGVMVSLDHMCPKINARGDKNRSDHLIDTRGIPTSNKPARSETFSKQVKNQ